MNLTSKPVIGGATILGGTAASYGIYEAVRQKEVTFEGKSRSEGFVRLSKEELENKWNENKSFVKYSVYMFEGSLEEKDILNVVDHCSNVSHREEGTDLELYKNCFKEFTGSDFISNNWDESKERVSNYCDKEFLTIFDEDENVDSWNRYVSTCLKKEEAR